MGVVLGIWCPCGSYYRHRIKGMAHVTRSIRRQKRPSDQQMQKRVVRACDDYVFKTPDVRGEREWVPYVMPLPDGRSVFVRVPAHMTGRDRDGSLTFKPEGVRYLDRVQVMAMDTPPEPTPGYIRTVREALRLTQAEFAKRLGRSTITVKKWEAGDARPGKEAVARLRRLVDRASRRGVVLT